MKTKGFVGLLIIILPFLAATFLPEIEAEGGLEVLSASLTGIVALTLILTEPLKNIIGTTGWGTRILSWAVSVVLMFGSSLLGWGFEAYQWWMFLVSGVGVGLVSNGVFTIEQVKAFLAMIYNK